MATVQRGKGTRAHSFDIVQFGSVLRSQETDAGGRRLPGYRRFSNAAAAAAALAAEVRAHLDDGLQPIDDEARAIAEARIGATSGGPPELPLRRDLAIYNEATGFVVTSRRMAGRTLEDGSAAWKRAATRGDLLPLTLVQDDPFLIRVVAGEPLTAQEEEEWVARVDWHLNVPDGKLCVTGGSVFSNEDYDPDDDYHEQFVGEVALPKGRYRAALYTHVHGVNGGGVLDSLGGEQSGEALEAWFARTRPGTPPPDWESTELVGFLLHLEPVDSIPTTGLSELPADGWFSGAEHARRPERCPAGIPAHDVVRRRSSESGEWTYVREIFTEVASDPPTSLSGGAPVALPLTSLAHAARLAWFGSRLSSVELRVTAPHGASLDLTDAWPSGVIAVVENGVGRMLFSADLQPSDERATLADVGARLADLPLGSTLDLCCAPVGNWPGARKDTGRLWLRGPIGDGVWQIAEASPKADAPALQAALTLAGEVEGGTTIGVRDPVEGEAILVRARRSFGDQLKTNPPALRGQSIEFTAPGHEVALVGIAAFAERHATTWAVVDLTSEASDPGA